ncbi:hypothetical protein ABZX51_010243 [Aspergillus tubingensis]
MTLVCYYYLYHSHVAIAAAATIAAAAAAAAATLLLLLLLHFSFCCLISLFFLFFLLLSVDFRTVKLLRLCAGQSSSRSVFLFSPSFLDYIPFRRFPHSFSFLLAGSDTLSPHPP